MLVMLHTWATSIYFNLLLHTIPMKYNIIKLITSKTIVIDQTWIIEDTPCLKLCNTFVMPRSADCVMTVENQIFWWRVILTTHGNWQWMQQSNHDKKGGGMSISPEYFAGFLSGFSGDVWYIFSFFEQKFPVTQTFQNGFI